MTMPVYIAIYIFSHILKQAFSFIPLFTGFPIQPRQQEGNTIGLILLTHFFLDEEKVQNSAGNILIAQLHKLC